MSEDEDEAQPIVGGRKKMRANKDFDYYKFRSMEHLRRYCPVQHKRMFKEKCFDLTAPCFSFIQKELQQRGWDQFHSTLNKANECWVREFYTNASSKIKTVPEYESWVRGESLKFDGNAINSVLGLTAPPECWVEEMRAKPLSVETYDMLVSSLCKPGSKWVPEKFSNTPKFLRFKDLTLIAKAWNCFYHASIEVCSTNYPKQLLVKNAFVVYGLMNEKPINLGQLIANSITYIINEDLWLGHSSIINLLCATKGVSEESGDYFVSPVVIDKSWYSDERRKIDYYFSHPLPNQQPETLPEPFVFPRPRQPAQQFKFPFQQNVQLFFPLDESTKEHEFRMLQLCDMQTRHGSPGQLPNWMHNSHEWMGYLQNYHNRNKERISREQFFETRYGLPPPEQMPPLTYFPPPYPQPPPPPQQDPPQPPHQDGDQTSGLGAGLGAAQELNFNHSSFAGEKTASPNFSNGPSL